MAPCDAPHLSAQVVMRKRLLLAGVLACVLTGGLLFLWATAEDRINLENFAKIQKGMTAEEVREILGPAGDYTNGRGLVLEIRPSEVSFAMHSDPTVWRGRELEIRVSFDGNGRVTHTECWTVICSAETFVQRIGRWLRL
jgi:hypothetical protein